MKLTGTYNGKTIELELTEEQVEVLKQAEKKKTEWERVKNNESYYVALYNNYGSSTELFDCVDANRYEKADYFADENLSTNIAIAQTLQRKLWRRSAELCEKMNWEDSTIKKYSIYYNYDIGSLRTSCTSFYRGLGEIYFDTKEHAEQVMEEFRDELIWYFTEFKSRMD